MSAPLCPLPLDSSSRNPLGTSSPEAEHHCLGATLPEQILASSIDCIKLLDAEGRVLWMNAAGMDLMEICDLGQVLGAPWASFWPPPQRPLIARALADAREAEGVGRFEGPCPTARGTAKWWDVAVTRLRSDAGVFDRFLVISRDITALVTLSRQRDELLARERLARQEAEAAVRARGDAFLVVAHELRAPLNAVRGWTGLLQMEGASPDEQAKGLTAIAHNAERMGLLVDGLTHAARAPGPLTAPPLPHPIGAILQSAIDAARPAARGRQVALRAEPFIEALVMADFQAAHRAVTNLLFNAIKFTPECGTVDVRCVSDGGQVRIDVVDSGIGIAPDFMPRLFEPFSQADVVDDGEGLGLGLSIVRGIIEAHGGSVEAFSDGPGHGATFSITLPVVL